MYLSLSLIQNSKGLWFSKGHLLTEVSLCKLHELALVGIFLCVYCDGIYREHACLIQTYHITSEIHTITNCTIEYYK
jgi:hypothetical protein